MKRTIAQRVFYNTQGTMTQKYGKIALLVIIGGSAFVSLNLYATKKSIDPHPTIFSDVEGTAWAQKCVEIYPEIMWLADIQVRKTEEGSALLKEPYSKQLFGQQFIEFDRTLMTLHCLKWILDGSDHAYEIFTKKQPSELKLSKESFQELSAQGRKLLESGWGRLSALEMAQAMETALVLGDMGKSEKARTCFKPYGAKAPDHDDFYGEALHILAKHPEICPSFSSLPKEAKKLLIKVANLAHYGHITHLEGGPSMYDKLRLSSVASEDAIALSFDLFVHTCDVAGALGHVNNTSSLVYTEPAHRAMQAMEDSVRSLADPGKTSLEVYKNYLAVRSNWLGLNTEQGMDRVLARIGAMLRLVTLQEGAIMKQATEAFSLSDQNQIISALDVQKEDKTLLRTPTYMPAVLVNLLNNPMLGTTREEQLKKAITIGLPFICKILEKHKTDLDAHRKDPNIPLNFNKIAGIAKTNPELLSNSKESEIHIDEEGMVYIK